MEEEKEIGEWYYNKNCKPLDMHKYSHYPQVVQCIDKLLFDLGDDLPNNKIYKVHLNMVVVDLYHRWHGFKFNGGLGYSRDNNAYRLKTRYNGLRIKKKPLLETIDKLLELGYINHMKGYKTDKQGFNSKIQATPKLIDYIKSFDIDPDCIWSSDQKEIIILKDKNGKKLEYKENEFTNRVREELLIYIDRLSKHQITIDGKNFIKLDTMDIHKVFQTDFKQYGRIYGGFWQHAVTSKERENIKIDNQETTELDYKNQMIKILYSLEGIDYDYDAYDVQGVDRKLVKKAVICMINCDSKFDAIRAIQGAINKDSYLYDYWFNKNRVNISDLLKQLEFKHQEVLKYFYNSSGALCQRIDSELASRIINFFVHQNKCLLGIHDSFICKKEDQDLLFKTMHREFQNLLKINVLDPNTLIS